jgi:hypothetical protein
MIHFRRMLSFEDVRWSEMTGGYRMRLDPRPLLNRLETESDTTQIWQELWDELHHQGDVGDASFAAVPYLVRGYRQRGVVNWNTFAIVAVIELARKEGKNPDVPGWLEEGHFSAIRELAKLGAADILRARSPEEVRAILSVLAIEKGLRTHGRFLVNYSEEEMLDFESRV